MVYIPKRSGIRDDRHGRGKPVYVSQKKSGTAVGKKIAPKKIIVAKINKFLKNRHPKDKEALNKISEYLLDKKNKDHSADGISAGVNLLFRLEKRTDISFGRIYALIKDAIKEGIIK